MIIGEIYIVDPSVVGIDSIQSFKSAKSHHEKLCSRPNEGK